MKRIIGILGAAAVLFAGAALMSPPAQAGVDTPSVLIGLDVNGRCAFDGTTSKVEVRVTGNPGDTFRVFNLGCGDGRVLFEAGAPVSGPGAMPNLASGPTYTLGANPGSGGMLVVTPTGSVLIVVTVTTVPVVTPVAQVHDTLQQVGVPASGKCADVPITVGHYPGYPVGGWSKSWAWWINNGKGGPVCTRELEQTASGEVILVG
jgi:hypothetical protein